jgi:thiol-disulfide isomerase/thioredoxin
MKYFLLIFSVLFISHSCVKKSSDNITTGNGEKNRPENAVKAPNFTLATLDGDWVTLDDFKGKVVLLNFWATWCGPCLMEIPDLKILQEKYNEKGLEVLAITLTSGSPKQISKFSEKWGMNYYVLTDIEGNETEMVTSYYGQATGVPISGVPTSFIIDREGYIVKSYIGPRTERIFANDLKKYL